MSSGVDTNPLSLVLSRFRGIFWSVGLFSCAVNVLMLTGPLFMLQVYDRVLASRSVPTLVALFGLVVGLYAFLGLFDFIRNKALARAGYRLDVELSAIAKKIWIYAGSVAGKIKSRPVNDLAVLRQFLSSNGLPALFDLPWVPFYLAVVYLLHVWLGLLATAGAVLVILLTVINEWLTKKPIGEASGYELQDARFLEQSNRNGEAVVAMGMVGDVTKHWQGMRNAGLGLSQKASDRSQSITALTKAIRMIVQSGLLALGAYLAIFQEITPGTMIAASILGGRALAPVDAAVANWKNFIRARQARERLTQALEGAVAGEEPVELPEPKGHVVIANLVKLPPAQHGQARESKPILQGLNFKLEPGDGLGVIGPSASGKSSLARLLTGLWMPDRGSVTLDGARFDQWDRDRIGKHIGYLPQSVELLPGTIRQNIARFDEEVSDEAVIEAAKLAQVHELILNLPEGYSTDLTNHMGALSGGQVQRIGLARAVLNMPALVVLDEPNSNLDAEGDEALAKAIMALRKAGSCVVVMAHRPSAIAAVNKVLVLREGTQVEFGDREEVLSKVTKAPLAHLPVAGNSESQTRSKTKSQTKSALKPAAGQKMTYSM